MHCEHLNAYDQGLIQHFDFARKCSDMRKVACACALHTGVFNRKFGNFRPKQRVESWEFEMDKQIFGQTLGIYDKANLSPNEMS